MTERVARLRAGAAGGDPSRELLARIEDALSDGYGLALMGDAWSMRTEAAACTRSSATRAPRCAVAGCVRSPRSTRGSSAI